MRPSFAKGLRNEVQVVETIMSLDPDHLYDVVAINAASMSTLLAGLPFSGPIGGVRVALIDGQWVAFPTYSELERAVFDMVVAGRVVGDDVAIMMVEAEATTETVALVAGGALRRPKRLWRPAWRQPSRSSSCCATRSPSWAPGREADGDFPASSTTRTTSSPRSRRRFPRRWRRR